MPRATKAVAAEAPVVPAPSADEPKLLTRDDILAAQDLATKMVDVPEWGGAVVVRGLTGRSRDSLEARFSDAKGNIDRKLYQDFRAAFVAESIIDEAHNRMFKEADITALGEKSSRALQRVFDAAVALSASRPEDIDGMAAELKDDPSASSGTD